MMKHCFSIMVSLMVVIPTFAQYVRDKEWGFHRELLKNKFATSYWKDIWEDELWHIRCIFVDVDGDGTEEIIAITTSEEDRMGDYWKLWKYDDAEKFRQVSFSGDFQSVVFRQGERSCRSGHERKHRRALRQWRTAHSQSNTGLQVRCHAGEQVHVARNTAGC